MTRLGAIPALLVALLACPATAKPVTYCRLLTDPRGDATIDESAPGVAPNAPALDIVGADVRLSTTHLIVRVQVAGLADTTATPTGMSFVVALDLPAGHSVELFAQQTVDGRRAWFERDGQWGLFPATAMFVTSSGTVTIQVRLTDLPLPLRRGSVVGDPHASSRRPIGTSDTTPYYRTYLTADTATSSADARLSTCAD